MSPTIDSAAATARTISRLIRKWGFRMADTSNRFKWTEGFHVHRLGCSKTVLASYHENDVKIPRSDEATRSLELKMANLMEFLKSKGYETKRFGINSLAIECRGE